MRGPILLLVASIALVAGASVSPKIVGGELTTIDQYPFGAALLIAWNGVTFTQSCCGSIINNRAVLSAAHCFISTGNHPWRIRVGSSFASSGGVVHNTIRIINHHLYNQSPYDNDIAILHSATAFTFNNNVRPGRIPGSNYYPADNAVVWAIGWGLTSNGGSPSEQLRHVQIWTVNQEICRNRYGPIITDNMLCSGWLDVGGRDQCSQDSGGPLIHNEVIVGVCSFGSNCGDPYYPGVNARVSRYTDWIQANA